MSTTTTLGLDLGITSIGWSLVEKDGDMPIAIKDMGVRIIPLTKDDENEFTQGNAISKNRSRTLKRTQRKGLDRYQLRRKALTQVLKANNMMPDKHLLLELSPLEIWGLRARAIKEQVTLRELGRILLHLNQRRGYNHSKSDSSDKEQTDYVQAVNDRHRAIREAGQTVGQHFYEELRKYFAVAEKTEEPFRVKEKVFPRAAYKEEFNRIWQVQQEYYPSLLTDELFEKVRNGIIYYQRKLKSQKGLVNVCEFEGKEYADKAGKTVFGGPKVAPRSSPLFQVEKIWESINTITVKNNRGETFEISTEQRQAIFEYLDNNAGLSQTKLFELLGLGARAGYFTNAQIRKKGLQGNLTKSSLVKELGEDHSLLTFTLSEEDYQNVDTATGEVTERRRIGGDFETQPLYRLWHTVYSLSEEDCIKKLTSDFGLTPEVAKKLAAIDFSKGGFGNKSAKAMRKILPYLREGLTYDKACAMAGYNHSDSITNEENLSRELRQKLDLLPKNSLRQPIVEKILNQLINVVNAIIEKHGKPNEIRIELARELRQSREERNDAYNNINKRERENKKIADMLLEHPEFRKKKVSKRDIDRYRLWEEFGKVSPYEPGKIISLGELFSGNYDIEHIIPRSLRFDDAFSNKTICPRRYNSGEFAKNAFTAFDYMQGKRSKDDCDAFAACIEKTYADKRISKSKYENLLRKSVDIQSDFIARQLNETRYITRKAKDILSQICYHVRVTSGAITQRLRDLWGWDKVLEQLNLPKYKELGLTEMVVVTHNGQTHEEERIKDWSKRDDHRHHAIDALAVACTRQSFIHRINSLAAEQTRKEMFEEVKDDKSRLSLLDKYLKQYRPFNTAAAAVHAAGINISFKPGKKTATYSRRLQKQANKKEIVQRGIIAPRGALSEESVYGKIFVKKVRTVKLDKSFQEADAIIDPDLKTIVKDWLAAHDNKPEAAFKDLKKKPIWVDEAKTTALTQVNIQEFKPEFVIKYPLDGIGPKDVPFIVDEAVKGIVAAHLKAHGDDPKKAWKDLRDNPLWFNEEKKIPIKRVRMFTRIAEDSVVPITVKDATWEIEYEKYVKPGNNHHIAIYKDADGRLQEHVVSFWHAVERKKWGLPVVIQQPKAVWDKILSEGRELPESFLEKLPKDGWEYVTSMQQNESFVFGMSEEDLRKAIEAGDNKAIAPNVFRVRKLSSGQYWFNQQYETQPRESLTDKKARRSVQASLSSMNGIKVKITALGEVKLASEKKAEGSPIAE